MELKTCVLVGALALAVLSFCDETHAEGMPIPNSACVYRPSTLIEPVVSSKAEKQSTTVIHFVYRLRNGGGALQNISIFKIEIPAGVSNLRAPGKWFGSMYKYKPVGGWAEASENRDLVVRAGQEVSGFQFDSVGLPSVVTFWTSGEELNGQEAGVSCPAGEADDEAVAYADFFFDSVKGKTIGPTAPPKVFDPLKFTEYIIDLKNQSVELGWIKTTDAATALDQKLQAIRAIAAEISGNQIPRARGQEILSLGAQFLQFVESNSCKDFDCEVSESQPPKPLSSEASALLFYNMDYLLSQVRVACGLPAETTPSPAPKRSTPSPARK